MSLKVYNTLTQSKDSLTPVTPGKIGMYVCGVTTYDLCHIGHARAGVVFDVIYRYLLFCGYEVNYIRNITDIDDKIIKRAREKGEPWDVLAQRFTDEFHKDMSDLGLLDPTGEPKATEHIPEMIEMIEGLIKKDHAYESEGSVYFAVRSFAEYGTLSHRNIEELESGARVDVNEAKKDPLDFALWKASTPDEPSWDSPWGKGRPGWHIECSAMGRKYLGVNFDIHGGGKDLVFPHHENEVAQSHASSGKAPVNYWVHNGFVTSKKEKMSKSIGNIENIRDLLKLFHSEAVRLFFLMHHYRSPIDFAHSYIVDASKNLTRFYDLLAFAEMCEGQSPNEVTAEGSVRSDFKEEMDDDFNTAKTIAVLNSELKRLNKTRATMGGMKKKSTEYKETLQKFLSDVATLKELGQVLGLFYDKPDEFFAKAKEQKLAEHGMTEADIERIINKRSDARKRKDFATSDRIRDELLSRGITLQDSPDGVTWSVKVD